MGAAASAGAGPQSQRDDAVLATRHDNSKLNNSTPCVGADDEINIEILYSVLQKLVFMFEVKESLATSVIEVICDSNLANHGEQVVAVEKWLNQHTDIQLNHEEISQLILYVELYENNSSFDDVDMKKGRPALKKTLSVSQIEFSRCRLMCPYRSEVSAWSADIRREEVKKMGITGDDPTMRLDCFEREDYALVR